MGKREKLIALAIKYDGEYFKIKQAIEAKEDIEGVSLDNCLTIFDENYPERLFDLNYPPFVLFYKGDINLINKQNIIGVVGSRIPCSYAVNACKDLVRNNTNKIIVSGLAKGIDGVAHETSDVSIGVLGCGIDYVYPKENLELFLKLNKQGLIISEYPFKVKPLSYHFPFRNRIIAALCDTLYVLQSSARSGTVTTINEALEIQRDVKVLPFSVYEKEGQYNNDLINDGALLITYRDLKIDK